jgi:hypothetical protein
VQQDGEWVWLKRKGRPVYLNDDSLFGKESPAERAVRLKDKARYRRRKCDRAFFVREINHVTQRERWVQMKPGDFSKEELAELLEDYRYLLQHQGQISPNETQEAVH